MKPLIRQSLFFLLSLAFNVNTGAQSPFAVPTYHCLGIYWSPAGGTSDKDVLVEYRKQGGSAWSKGLNMAYHPIAETNKDKADYRGSIVNLTPNTSYEIKLSLEGTSTTETFTASTWNEDFPEGETVDVGYKNTTYKITQSGTPTAYRVYDGTGNMIDVEHKHDYCIEVDASYVIIRNFTLRGAGDTTVIDSWPPRSAILLYDGVTDVVIEGCDISEWGTHNTEPLVPHHGENYESAIYSRRNVARVTIQRNKFHHPTFQSNSWREAHPNGPQCITLFDSQGNHVIRYNEGWSDIDHYFNDVIGAGENASYEGFPGDDSDIYGNYFANGWDDGIEAEGANQNVRIWNNYITNTFMAIANAATSIGPLYIWRNVSHISYSPPNKYNSYYNFLKMGFASGVEWMTGNMYVFHNTIYNVGDQGYDGLGGEGRVIRHCTSRNNILSVRNEASNSIAIDSESLDNDFDYDLYNKTVPGGSEVNGENDLPTYVSGSGFDFSTKTGNFQLQTFSSGFDAGVVIPNFSDGYLGDAPDMGAHEKGWNNFVYGIKAVFTPPNMTSIPAIKSNHANIKVYPNPFINTVTFDLQELSPCDIIITDIAGKVVRSVLNESGKVVMERGDLNPGLYLYRVVSEEAVVHTGKLVIMGS